jgi:hypothetical protein
MRFMGKLIIVLPMAVFLISGCMLPPRNTLFKNQFNDIETPDASLVRESPFTRTYPVSFGQTLKGALTILAGYAIIPRVTRLSDKAAAVIYIDVDGFYEIKKIKQRRATFFIPAQYEQESEAKEKDVVLKRIFSADLPFTVLVEGRSDGETAVYVLPRTELVEAVFLRKSFAGEYGRIIADGIPDKYMEIIKTDSVYKAHQFLERLSTQLSADKRWEWLIQ